MFPITDLIWAFTLGLATSFSPCLFPVLPSFLAFLTGTETSRKNGFISSILVTLGVLIVFVFMGILLQGFRNLFFDFFNPNYVKFRFAEGVVLVVLGMLYAGKKYIGGGVFSRFSDWTVNIITSTENPWLGSFLIGLFFAVLAAPCALILFITVFTLIINSATVFNGILISTAFAIGTGIPFVLMGAVIPSIKENILANKEKIFKYLPIITGLIIVAVGTFLIYDAIELGFSI